MPRASRTTKPTPLTIAFAGDAEVDYNNVQALLDDLVGVTGKDADGWPELPDREINLIVPGDKDKVTDAVRTFLDWSEWVNLGYVVVTTIGEPIHQLTVDEAERVGEVTGDVALGIVNLLKDAEGESLVILAYGSEDEFGELLLDAAITAGIPVKDITHGLDDIAFQEEEDEKLTPEPEPVARKSRAKKTETVTLEQPELPLDEAQPEPDEAQANLGTPRPEDIVLPVETLMLLVTNWRQMADTLEGLLMTGEVVQVTAAAPESDAAAPTTVAATPHAAGSVVPAQRTSAPRGRARTKASV